MTLLPIFDRLNLGKLGLSESGTVRRGYVANAGPDSVAATTGGDPANSTSLATPDKVSNVVVPTNGLLAVAYSAHAEITAAAGASTAGVLIGGCVLRIGTKWAMTRYLWRSNGDTDIGGFVDGYEIRNGHASGGLAFSIGTVYNHEVNGLNGWHKLDNFYTGTGHADPGPTIPVRIDPDLSNPYQLSSELVQSIPGPWSFYSIQAGTYDVEVKWNRTSVQASAINVLNRKLWVYTIGF